MAQRAAQHTSILNEGDISYRAVVTKYSPTWPASRPFWTSTPTLGSGTVLNVVDWSISRSRDQLSAGASITLAADFQGTYLDTVQKMDLLRIQLRIDSATYKGRLLDAGWFLVDSLRISGSTISLECRDAMMLGMIDPYHGTLAGDRIQEPLQNPGTTEYKVLDLIEKADYYLFIDSDQTDDPRREVDHTTNWSGSPSPEFLRSADQTALKAAGDELLDVNIDAVKILYGLGEIRIDKQVYDSDYAALPYIKARYWRYANYTDVIRGSVTTVSTTVITDAVQAFVVDRYIGSTVRFTSGAQRFRSFGVTDNAATTLTLDTDVAALNVGVGDRYELVDMNDPRWRFTDLAIASDFQTLMESRPFFIGEVGPLLLEKDPAMVLKGVS